MESPTAAMAEGTMCTNASVAGSPEGSMPAGRRHKNLMKFRRHVAAQRQSTHAHSTSPDDNKEDVPLEETVVALKPDNDVRSSCRSPPLSPVIGGNKGEASPKTNFKKRADLMKKLSKKRFSNNIGTSNLISETTNDGQNHSDNVFPIAEPLSQLPPSSPLSVKSSISSKAKKMKQQKALLLKKGEKTDKLVEHRDEATDNKHNPAGEEGSDDSSGKSNPGKNLGKDIETQEENVISRQKRDEVTAPEAALEKPNQVVVSDHEQQGEEPPNVFDLRSIHEFPPALVSSPEAVETAKDPTWDTAKVFFSEYSPNKKKYDETLDVFETEATDAAAWVASDTMTFSTTFETRKNGFCNGFVEPSDIGGEVGTALSVKTGDKPVSPGSDCSPRRLRARMEVGMGNFDAAFSLAFGVSNVGLNQDEEMAPSRDDEDLLADSEDTNSDRNDIDIWKSNSKMSKEQRLGMYESHPDDRENSSVSSNEESSVVDDESSVFSTQGEIEYVEQPEGEEEDDDDRIVGLQDATAFIDFAFDRVENAPEFLVAVNNAVATIEENTDIGPYENGEHLAFAAVSVGSDARSTDEDGGVDFRKCDGDVPQSLSFTGEDLMGEGLLASWSTSDVAPANTPGGQVTVDSQGAVFMEGAGLVPPPPPPPALKKKRSKNSKPKSNDVLKKVPVIAPPPEEKIKKWEESKNRPFLPENSSYGAFTDISSPMGSEPQPPRIVEEPTFHASHFPVHAGRSIAIGNALRWANDSAPRTTTMLKGDSRSSSPAAFQTSLVTASTCSTEDPLENIDTLETPTVEGPPDLMRRKFGDKGKLFEDPPGDYLQKLTAPSESTSPSHKPTPENSSPTNSPIIHDRKVAEKVALASSAAARTFEEQYRSSHSPDADSASVTDTDVQSEIMPSLFCDPGMQKNFESMASKATSADIAELLEEKGEQFLSNIVGSPLTRSRSDKLHDTGVELVGGAFSPWKNSVYGNGSTKNDEQGLSIASSSASACRSEQSDNLAKLQHCKAETHNGSNKLYKWFVEEALELEAGAIPLAESDDAIHEAFQKLLDDDKMLNALCRFTTVKVNAKIQRENEERAARNGQISPRKKLQPFSKGGFSRQKPSVLAANFVSYMYRISKVTEVPSPLGEENPFLLDLVSTSIHGGEGAKVANVANDDSKTMQELVFSRCTAEQIVQFSHDACLAVAEPKVSDFSGDDSFDMIEAMRAENPSPTKKSKGAFFADKQPIPPGVDRKLIVPLERPSPFEAAVKGDPKIITHILSWLGDPESISRLKMVSLDCNRFIRHNEHELMRDAVRLGGLSMNRRPAFWLWVTLEKCRNQRAENGDSSGLAELEAHGRESQWHHVIQRDVARSFGNMPPHKTGARLRTDSIVRALVSWGRSRMMKRGVRGDGNPPSSESQYSMEYDSKGSDASQTPTDTVSDWGGVSPVASFAGSVSGAGENEADKLTGKSDGKRHKKTPREDHSETVATELLVLSGNALTDEMKADLQNKLGVVLHALAAAHDDVGYCQGMDYVVAHLLRILQDTVRWRAGHGTLPACIHSAPKPADLQKFDTTSLSQSVEEIDKTLVVEETVFRVMDTLFTTYNLQHMYWPELRCLKTCCRVFERLIQIKLPVLADHFEHHELNVGLFALGWFQTLFLYLPSMPSATVCHMWDIWLVERSFKIFFRVGTAILFLSQPILLNHELEGMMTYLNTFPDATLLNPDILIACALQIKVTNKMLMDIEADVSGVYKP